jgi:pimeloyl-ACP methyl ester carboxylesterase
VSIVASHLFEIKTPQGAAEMPLDLSLDWDKPQPQVVRAVVVFHGKGRDVDGYYHASLKAAERAGPGAAATSVVVAPQFLNVEDALAHNLPGNVLRWRQGAWEAGKDAAGPFAESAYSVIDAIVEHLADRQIFPNLKVIVLAGHSGGGQAVQRYAVVGQAEQIAGAGVRLKYVVANPSSYLYLGDERPVFDKQRFRFEKANVDACPDVNHWKYGPVEAREAYVERSAAAGWQRLEDGFARKDVTYLLGTADIDPHEKDLDTDCAAEMQGPNRFLRGQAYYAGLHHRHPDGWKQRMWFVPGVAHVGGQMIDSECGVAALFDGSSCPDR